MKKPFIALLIIFLLAITMLNKFKTIENNQEKLEDNIIIDYSNYKYTEETDNQLLEISFETEENNKMYLKINITSSIDNNIIFNSETTGTYQLSKNKLIYTQDEWEDKTIPEKITFSIENKTLVLTDDFLNQYTKNKIILTKS